jgi:hypothetical protein
MVGTGLALLLIVGLSSVFVRVASLTGVTSDEAVYVRTLFGQVDLRGLLLAGIVIGALGILDDVTVTQVSIVWELRNADPTMSTSTLYAAALRVGRDHIASTVNTLLLAYAGASMPLLVIFATSGDGIVGTVTSAAVAEEVVRTLVGSIGLVAAVPLTTALAAAMCPPSSAAGAPCRAPPTELSRWHRHRIRLLRRSLLPGPGPDQAPSHSPSSESRAMRTCIVDRWCSAAWTARCRPSSRYSSPCHAMT